MVSLHDDLTDYLEQRRALGYQLTTSEYLLRQFCTWLHTHGHPDSFTVDDAVEWAIQPRDTTPIWRAQRLATLRPFAAWLHARNPAIPIIPAGLLPVGTTRRQPFIYTQSDLDRLLDGCALHFPSPRVAVTMRMFIGLLAATGLRPGEALRLTIPDLDTDNQVLLVRGRKTLLDRLVPLHPTTIHELGNYLDHPARQATQPAPTGPIFVNHRGGGFRIETIEQHFHSLVDALDLAVDGQPRPRLHDFRHTFATCHLLAAYTQGRDPARTLTLLTTWLGHSSPEHTYWYLTAVPELLAAAVARLDHTHLEEEPS